jgi:hypothetical protein
LFGASGSGPPRPALAQADRQWILEQSTLTYHVSHPLHQTDGVSHAARGKGVCHAGQCDLLIAVYCPHVETKYGLRGSIVPGGIADESFDFEGFPVTINGDVIEIGFNDSGDQDRAKEIVRRHLAAFSLQSSIGYTTDLNQSWALNPGGINDISISVADRARVDDSVRMTQVTIGGTARVVSPDFESVRVSNGSDLVRKSFRDPALAKALTYFSEEVIDDNRPLYGVYKAFEELRHAVGGEENLAKLVGQTKSYVEAIRRTTQLTRHAITQATQALTEAECCMRMRILIEAYAKSI